MRAGQDANDSAVTELGKLAGCGLRGFCSDVLDASTLESVSKALFETVFVSKCIRLVGRRRNRRQHGLRSREVPPHKGSFETFHVLDPIERSSKIQLHPPAIIGLYRQKPPSLRAHSWNITQVLPQTFRSVWQGVFQSNYREDGMPTRGFAFDLDQLVGDGAPG